jgi:hypothetical protein
VVVVRHHAADLRNDELERVERHHAVRSGAIARAPAPRPRR